MKHSTHRPHPGLLWGYHRNPGERFLEAARMASTLRGGFLKDHRAVAANDEMFFRVYDVMKAEVFTENFR